MIAVNGQRVNAALLAAPGDESNRVSGWRPGGRTIFTGMVGKVKDIAAVEGILSWKKVAEPSESLVPNWPLKFGQTVNDGSCIWQNIGHDEIWDEETAYSLNEVVYPSVENGYCYKCITAGTSGTSAPIWPTALNFTVTDGTVVWRCYQRTPITVLTEASVTIPNGPAWFDIVSARSGGIMKIYTGIIYQIGEALYKKMQLNASLPITGLGRQSDSNKDFVTVKGSLQGKENYYAGEINWPLTKHSAYSMSSEKVHVDYPYIYEDIRPGDKIVLQSGSFEIGRITINVTPKTKRMGIEEW